MCFFQTTLNLYLKLTILLSIASFNATDIEVLAIVFVSKLNRTLFVKLLLQPFITIGYGFFGDGFLMSQSFMKCYALLVCLKNEVS